MGRAFAPIILALGIMATSVAAAADLVRLGGTGSGLRAMEIATAKFATARPGFAASVLPSLGTSGGIRALRDGAIDLAIAARGANAEEKAAGIEDAACFATAFVFVTSHPMKWQFTREQLVGMYAAARPAWPDGTNMRIILRARSGSEIPFLGKNISGMVPALEAALARHEIPVAITDQDNAELAMRTAGSLAVMTLLQLRAEALDLRALSLDGVEPSVATLENGRYPLEQTICLLRGPRSKPGAADFIAYVRSAEGARLLRDFGAVAR